MSGEIAIVLGSGLGGLADRLEVEQEWGFEEIGLPCSKVKGHAGRMLYGKLLGVHVWMMKGRVHVYEGHSAQAVTSGVRWLHEQGVGRFLLTNAAGTLNERYAPGTWMMLDDHLNLTGTSPLEGGPNFFDMSDVYTKCWRDKVKIAADGMGMTLHEGVYAGLRGPQYETPAEIRMLRHLGADAVGMSTVLEAIQARALGCEVLAFSCLTNWAAGMGEAELAHAEVIETGLAAASPMMDLIDRIIAL